MCYHNVEIAAIETLVSHSQISTLSKELSFSKIWESHSRSRLSIFQRILSFSFSTLKNLPEKSHSQSRLSRIFPWVLILDLDSQSSYSRRSLGTTWQCPFFSVVPESMHEHEASRGRHASSKSPSRVRDRDEGVAGRNGREKCFPDKGSLICPPAQCKVHACSSLKSAWILFLEFWKVFNLQLEIPKGVSTM